MAVRVREEIRRKIEEGVLSRWPTLTMRTLPGSRFCFSRVVDDDPLPLYEHLVVHHRRRQHRVEARWSYGLFPVYVYERLPDGFQAESPVSRAEVSEGLQPLLDWAQAFHENEGAVLKQRQLDDTRVHLYLWNLYSGKGADSIPEPYRATCRALVESKKFKMVAPAAVRVSSFLSDLVPEGAQSEEGAFSLESSRARQKLSGFLLADPRQFYLHVVAGAIAGGAPEVKVYFDSDDVIVNFAGEPLESFQLENLFSSLLAGRAGGQERELAVALNAALSLNPSVLDLESRKRGKGTRLSVSEGGEALTELKDGEDGHRLHFRARASLGVARRFVVGLHGPHPEYEILAQRFRYAPIPVRDEKGRDLRLLPGDEVLTGVIFERAGHPLPTLDVPAELVERRESPWEASVVILFGPASGVYWMTHGLLYEPPVSVAHQGLWILVSDSKAGRDLSFSHIVKDRRVEELGASVAREAAAVLEQLLSRYGGFSEEQKLKWVEAMQGLQIAGVSLPSGLPIYKAVAGGLVSRSDLLNTSKISVVEHDFPVPLRSGEPVYVISRELRATLDANRLVDVTQSLERTQIYHERRRQWLEAVSPGPPEPREEGLFTRPYRQGAGRFSLVPSHQSKAQVDFVLENRVLHSEFVDALPRGLKAVVWSDEFDRDWEWKRFKQEGAATEAFKGIHGRLGSFYQDVFQQGASLGEHGLEYLLYLHRRGQDWRRFEDDLLLPTLGGGEISLKALWTSIPWANLPPGRHDLEDSLQASLSRRMELLKRVVSKATVPWDILFRVWELRGDKE